MAVQDAVFFPLPKDLKADLFNEFSDDSEMTRLIEDEALALGEQLLRFYKKINRSFAADEVLAALDDPVGHVAELARRAQRLRDLLLRWYEWATAEFRTPELFKQRFREFFPRAGEEWRRWLDEETSIIRRQLSMARDELRAGYSALGHSRQEPVGDRNQAIMYVEILIDEWDRILSENFERVVRQARPIRYELALF